MYVCINVRSILPPKRNAATLVPLAAESQPLTHNHFRFHFPICIHVLAYTRTHMGASVLCFGNACYVYALLAFLRRAFFMAFVQIVSTNNRYAYFFKLKARLCLHLSARFTFTHSQLYAQRRLFPILYLSFHHLHMYISILLCFN